MLSAQQLAKQLGVGELIRFSANVEIRHGKVDYKIVKVVRKGRALVEVYYTLDATPGVVRSIWWDNLRKIR